MDIIVAQNPDAQLGAGSPNESTLGDREAARILGVEAVWEYNGLVMNVRNWVDSFLFKNIAGLDDADVRDAREANPGDHGETPQNSLYGGRTMMFTGWIETRTLFKLRDMEQAMRQAFSPLVEQRLIMRTNDIRKDLFIMCKKHQKLDKGEEQTTQNLFTRTFQIPLRASKPWFLSYVQEYEEVDVSSGIATIAVPHVGNFEARPVFEWAGPADAGSEIFCHETNHRLILGQDIADGQTFTIDTDTNIIVDDSTNELIDGALDPDSDNFRLKAFSINNIDVEATGTNSNSLLGIKWRHTYL